MIAPVKDSVTGETITAYLGRRLSSLKQDRSTYMSHWQTIGDNFQPRATRFNTTEKNQGGSKRNTKIINNTGLMALRTLSAGMMSGITSPSRPWFNLRTTNAELNNVQVVKVYLSAVKDILSQAFLRSNLYTVLPVVYEDLGAFGTSAFALMEDDEDGIRCYPFPLGSYVLGVGPRGNVSICIREYKMKVGQLVKQFGLDDCSATVQQAFRAKQYDTEIDVVHAVEDNPDADETKLDSRYLPYRSVYYEASGQDGNVLSIKGLHEFAVMAPRWRVVGEDTWGNSPCMDVLGDSLQLQQMEKRKLQALDMLVNPPRSAPVGMRNEYIGTLSGEITFIPDGMIGATVAPNYVINPYLDHIGAEIANVERRIKHGLFEDLFLMISDIDRGGTTATEIQARQQEKMMAMGPVLERLNDEMLDHIVRRTYGILYRAGKLPDLPEELTSPVVIEYISVMAQAMKLQGVTAVERLVGFVGSVSGGRPDALDKLNTDAAIDAYSDMVGVPPAIVNSDDVVAKTRAQRAQADEAQRQLAMVQQGADTAKTMSETDVSTPSMLQSMAGVLQQAGPLPIGGR